MAVSGCEGCGEFPRNMPCSMSSGENVCPPIRYTAPLSPLNKRDLPWGVLGVPCNVHGKYGHVQSKHGRRDGGREGGGVDEGDVRMLSVKE